MKYHDSPHIMWDEMRNRQKPHGRHPHHRLTAVSVNAKKAPGRYADGNGLYLVVDPSGAKRWIWRGVVQGKRSRSRSRQRASSSRSATPATKRSACRRLARAGGNPLLSNAAAAAHRADLQGRGAGRSTPSTARRSSNAKHARAVARLARGRCLPRHRDASGPHDRRRRRAARCSRPIWTTKPETARRLKQRMKVVFDWAKASGSAVAIIRPTA